jgi:hypothetical protein
MLAQRAVFARRPVPGAHLFAMPAQQLVRSLQRSNVVRQLSLGGSLDLAIHGVVAAVPFAIAQPIQHPCRVGIKREHGPLAAEELDPFDTGSADPRIGLPRCIRETKLGASAEPFDPIVGDAGLGPEPPCFLARPRPKGLYCLVSTRVTR